MSNFADIPQPEELSGKEKEQAMTSYLMMFASTAVGLPFPMINLIAAIAYHYMVRDRSRFVHFHSSQSLISQLPVTFLNAIAVGWVIHSLFNSSPDAVTLFDKIGLTDEFISFLIMVATANVIYFLFSLLAAIQAFRGRMFYFIFFGKVAYVRAFKISASSSDKPRNRPPSL